MNSLIKITSGKLRGRSIKSPNSPMTHPMGAREKLALFNTISEYLPDAKVLDVYAGSGALGIEAVSRGAKQVTFIEKNAKTCKVIRDNLTGLDLDAEVLMMDAKDYVSSEKFDIILVDPPYDMFEKMRINHLSRNLAEDGVLVLSHPDGVPNLPGLRLVKTSKYANAHISIYKTCLFDESVI